MTGGWLVFSVSIPQSCGRGANSAAAHSDSPGRVAPVESHPCGSGAACSQNPLRGPATTRHPKVSYLYSSSTYTAVSISLVKQIDNHLSWVVVVSLRRVCT